MKTHPSRLADVSNLSCQIVLVCLKHTLKNTSEALRCNNNCRHGHWEVWPCGFWMSHKHHQHWGDAKYFTVTACGKQRSSLRIGHFFATTVIYINLGCLSSECLHKASFKCGQTAPEQRGTLFGWQTRITHREGLCELDGCAISGLLPFRGRESQALI